MVFPVEAVFLNDCFSVHLFVRSVIVSLIASLESEHKIVQSVSGST